MARFRMFLACLLLVAIPLQGLAAVSMLFCGSSGPAHQSAAVAQEHHDQSHSAATGGDHAMHQHAGHDEATSKAEQQTGGPSLPDPGQSCSVCAACCNSVAISETPNVPTLSPAQSISAEPLDAVYSRPSPVPDKPPRT
jgi:hypothetical protein